MLERMGALQSFMVAVAIAIVPVVFPTIPLEWGMMIWAGCAAIALYPWIASIREKVPERAPLNEFMALTQKAGWNGSDTLKLLDGLRQAGVDGAIAFWGRPKKSINHRANMREPLQLIDPDHWKVNKIEVLSIVLGDNENTATVEADFTRIKTAQTYCDIRVNLKDARKWLNRHPPT